MKRSLHSESERVYYKVRQLTLESRFSWKYYSKNTGTTCTIKTLLFSLSSRSANLLFVIQFWIGYCMKHTLKYTMWKLHVFAACWFLFQGNPSCIKRDTCILPLVHLFFFVMRRDLKIPGDRSGLDSPRTLTGNPCGRRRRRAQKAQGRKPLNT